MKTSELADPALDWAVAKCEGVNLLNIYDEIQMAFCPKYSTDWSQGGPIIEREMIWLRAMSSFWHAQYGKSDEAIWNGIGPTPLVAAMRCYVASKLGDEVEIPKELQ